MDIVESVCDVGEKKLIGKNERTLCSDKVHRIVEVEVMGKPEQNYRMQLCRKHFVECAKVQPFTQTEKFK